jgi:hypothetical protein
MKISWTLTSWRHGKNAFTWFGAGEGAGVLRLRVRIRKTNPHASLRMTAWLELPQRLQPFPNICAYAALKRRSSTALQLA